LVKLRPDMLEAYNTLGVLHASLGQHEEAKRWLTAGLQRATPVPAVAPPHTPPHASRASIPRPSRPASRSPRPRWSRRAPRSRRRICLLIQRMR
jgi:hypothetical protein